MQPDSARQSAFHQALATPHSGLTGLESPSSKISKTRGKDTKASESYRERDVDLIAAFEMKSSDLNKIAPTNMDARDYGTPPCAPGPSSASFPITKRYEKDVPDDIIQRLPQTPPFIRLENGWTNPPGIRNEDMGFDYLPDGSPLKGKGKAEWKKKDIDPMLLRFLRFNPHLAEKRFSKSMNTQMAGNGPWNEISWR